jgi:hypothetical protein
MGSCSKASDHPRAAATRGSVNGTSLTCQSGVELCTGWQPGPSESSLLYAAAQRGAQRGRDGMSDSMDVKCMSRMQRDSACASALRLPRRDDELADEHEDDNGEAGEAGREPETELGALSWPAGVLTGLLIKALRLSRSSHLTKSLRLWPIMLPHGASLKKFSAPGLIAVIVQSEVSTSTVIEPRDLSMACWSSLCRRAATKRTASASTSCADLPALPRERAPAPLGRGKTIKKDKGTQSPRDRPCAVVVEPASPSRDAGPPVRTTREVFKRLVATLDSVLPTDFRSVPCPNGAGARSLGNAGRSSHDVLADAVRFVAAHRHKLDQQAMLTERVSLMQTMLRSRGAITVEVETFDCIIAAMSPGAENFFKDAPWGNMIGQSLRDFVQWEDLDNFNSLMNPVGLPIEDRACTIRLIHFAVSDFPPLQQHIATSPFAESALDYEDEALILVRDSSADGWSDAFEHDPMLCDHAENNSSTHKPHLLGNYVKTSFQVLRTSNAPQSALVAITLL